MLQDHTVREVSMPDLDGLMALYAQLQPDDPEVENTELVRVFEQICHSEHLHLFVLQAADSELLATCYLNVIANLTRGASPYGVIENVVTKQTMRNRGLGKAVVHHALQFAWRAGCYKVMLQTGSRREATHKFYKSCGFQADDKFAFVARPPID